MSKNNKASFYSQAAIYNTQRNLILTKLRSRHVVQAKSVHDNYLVLPDCRQINAHNMPTLTV